MTYNTDLLLRDYFRYLTEELKKISESLSFPFIFYMGEVKNPEELRKSYKSMDIVVKGTIKARGRNHTGPIGDYFWKTSEVEGLEGVVGELFQGLDAAYKRLYNR